MPRAALLLALLLSLWPAGTLAQTEGAAEPVDEPQRPGTNRASVAQLLFLKGREAYDGGDYAHAERFFRQSYELDQATGTLLNLALAEDKVGKLSEAWQHAREVVDALPPDDSRAPIARSLWESLDARLPRLQLMLDGRSPPDAVVELDGILVQGVMLGTAIPVNPGSHDIVVRAPGRRVRHVSIQIDEGQRLARVVAPGPLAPPVSPPVPHTPPEPDTEVNGVEVAGATLLAVGGASLVASLVLGGLVLDRKSTVDDHCDANRVCDDEAFTAADEGRRFAAASTGTFIAGLALATAGTIVLIVAPKREATLELHPGAATFRLRF
jgi:hypothetical protein